MENQQQIKGRGASGNPANRFEPLWIEPDPDQQCEEKPPTEYFHETSRSAITYNDSPDVNFNASVNPYRGCEHGCAYCYARPGHEYLGYSAGLDFETKILVKTDAPELLKKELSAPKWKPQVIGMCGVTDPYQPVEKQLELTRRCLTVLQGYRNPVALITKNHLVTRDTDILGAMAADNTASVAVSITTLDAALARTMEPRASHPAKRLRAIETLTRAGVPVTVLAAPMIPGLNDHEMPEILQRAADAGAVSAGYILLRLPYGVKDVFSSWLSTNYPDRAVKVMNRQRKMHGDRLNLTNYGERMKGQGAGAQQLADLFEICRRRSGFKSERPSLSTEHFRIPDQQQIDLFADHL